MALALRDYQDAAVTAALDAVKTGLHPVLALPTGSGKSLCCAALCATLPGRVLVASHRYELLEQDARALHAYDPSVPWGIYSAGLKRRETHQKVIFGGVQSIYNRLSELQAAGHFGTIIIDEAHLCPREGDAAVMYNTVFRAYPDAQRVGLSATPFRLDSGLLYEGEGRWFDCLASHISMRALTPEYLSPLRGVLTAANIDTEGVRVRAGEFVAGDLAQRAMDESILTSALDELCQFARLRHHWLVFCINVEHTELVAAELHKRGIPTGVLTSNTSAEERPRLLADFREGKLRALANCQILTTGYDYPGIDCIVLLRPTMSKSLMLQMVGRGARLAPAKHDCVIFDYANNIARHSPLDELWDVRSTPARRRQDAAVQAHNTALARARSRQGTHGREASLLDPMTGEPLQTFTYAVHGVTYDLVKSKNPRYPDTQILVVKYHTPARRELHPGYPAYMWQYICVEYTGFARTKAEQWFKRRGVALLPNSALMARRMAQSLDVPVSLRVVEKQPWAEILVEHFAEESDEKENPDG